MTASTWKRGNGGKQHAAPLFSWLVDGRNPAKPVVVYHSIWMFPKIRGKTPKMDGMENPIKIDDLGVPLILETPIYSVLYGFVFSLSQVFGRDFFLSASWKSSSLTA